MKKYAIGLLLLVLSLPVFAQQETLPASVRQVCGPYLQNVTDSSFTVIWTTNMDAVSWVELAPDDGTNWNNTARAKYYDLRGFGRRPVTKVHHVTVGGLQPDTKYRYRIMMEGVTGQYDRTGISYTPGYGLDVKTHPTAARTKARSYDHLHIATVNDMHEGDSVFRRIFSDARQQRYDFVVFNGDMTSQIADEKDLVSEYLKSASALFGSETPIYAVRGNHEYRGNDALKWMDYWETPTGKPYFTAAYGKFFFIFLDSGEDKYDGDIRNLGIMITDQYTDEEARWLKQVVGCRAFREADVRIVFSHIPPDPKGWFGNAVVANKFVPILNGAGIDLMLCGHIHNYKYYESGKTDAKFPVVCNKNRELMTVDVDKGQIRLQFFDPDHKKLRSLDFKTRRY